MKPQLKRTTIRGFNDKPLFQYVFFFLEVFYIGARYKYKQNRWNYQIGVAKNEWIMPHLIITFKSKPLITNIYILSFGMFLIYIPYYIAMNIIILVWIIFKATIEWIVKPNDETAYWTTLIWFIVAVIFIGLYIFK